MRKATLKIGLLVGLSGMFLGAVSGHARLAAAAQEQAAGVQVKIDNFSFTPQEITVQAGTTVTWVNQDDVPHTVVSTDNKFKSKALDTDDKFSFTFKEMGTYQYYCSVHPKMTAKVIVK